MSSPATGEDADRGGASERSETVMIEVNGSRIKYDVFVDPETGLDIDPVNGAFRTREETIQYLQEIYNVGGSSKELLNDLDRYNKWIENPENKKKEQSLFGGGAKAESYGLGNGPRQMQPKSVSVPASVSSATEKLKADAIKKKDMGNEALKQGDFRLAIRRYKEGLELDSKNAVLWSNLAEANLRLKRFDEALAAAERVLQIDWKNEKGLFRKASATFGLGKVKQARSLAVQGLSKSDASSKALWEGLLSKIDVESTQEGSCVLWHPAAIGAPAHCTAARDFDAGEIFRIPLNVDAGTILIDVEKYHEKAKKLLLGVLGTNSECVSQTNTAGKEEQDPLSTQLRFFEIVVCLLLQIGQYGDVATSVSSSFAAVTEDFGKKKLSDNFFSKYLCAPSVSLQSDVEDTGLYWSLIEDAVLPCLTQEEEARDNEGRGGMGEEKVSEMTVILMQVLQMAKAGALAQICLSTEEKSTDEHLQCRSQYLFSPHLQLLQTPKKTEEARPTTSSSLVGSGLFLPNGVKLMSPSGSDGPGTGKNYAFEFKVRRGISRGERIFLPTIYTAVFGGVGEKQPKSSPPVPEVGLLFSNPKGESLIVAQIIQSSASSGVVASSGGINSNSNPMNVDEYSLIPHESLRRSVYGV